MLSYLIHLALIFLALAAVCWLVFMPGRRPKLGEAVLGIVIAATATFLVAPAWAADAATTHVTIPIGDILNELAVPLFALITGIITWMIRKLPGAAKAWIDTLRVEQLLERAVAYGINSVAGATKDKVLDVNVRLPVAAYILQYALDRIPSALLSWVGGPTSLAEMIWSRLDISESGGRPDLESLAREIAAGTSVRVAVAKVRATGGS
jgi:hypothetical protein